MNKHCSNMVKDNQGRDCLPCGDVVGEMGDYTQALCKKCVKSLTSKEDKKLGYTNLKKFHKYIKENPTSSDKNLKKLIEKIQKEKIRTKEVYKQIDADMKKADRAIKRLKERTIL